MNINSNYIVVDRIEPPKQEGFEAVTVTDTFHYAGKVILLPEQPVFVDNRQLQAGDTVLWPKYSPDTHEVEYGGRKVKFVRITDILAVL